MKTTITYIKYTKKQPLLKLAAYIFSVDMLALFLLLIVM